MDVNSSIRCSHHKIGTAATKRTIAQEEQSSRGVDHRFVSGKDVLQLIPIFEKGFDMPTKMGYKVTPSTCPYRIRFYSRNVFPLGVEFRLPGLISS
jgi:hypothetical protein